MKKNWIILIIALLALSACSSSSEKKRTPQQEQKNPANLYVQLGIQYMGLGKEDVAMMNLQKALKIDPDYADAHNTIAVLYQRVQRPELAAQHYRKAVNIEPENPSIQNNYGQFLCNRGQYAEADEHFRQAIDNPLYGKTWVALSNAGHCARLAGNLDSAESYLRKALSKNPEFSPALIEMMQVSFIQNNHMSVRAFLQRYLAGASHTPETLRIGILSESQQGNDDLVEQYEKYLLQHFPDSPEATALRNGRLQ